MKKWLDLRGANFFFVEADKAFREQVFSSIVVSIPACHAGDRGSIPRESRRGSRSERTRFRPAPLQLALHLYSVNPLCYAVILGTNLAFLSLFVNSAVEFGPTTPAGRLFNVLCLNSVALAPICFPSPTQWQTEMGKT